MSNYDFKYPPVKQKQPKAKSVREVFMREFGTVQSINKSLKFIYGVDKHIIKINNAFYTGNKKLIDFKEDVFSIEEEILIDKLESLYFEYKLNLL